MNAITSDHASAFLKASDDVIGHAWTIVWPPMAYRRAVASHETERKAMTWSGRSLATMLLLASSWGCGGGLEGSLRSMAAAHRSELAPNEDFLACDRGEVRVEALPAMQVWTGQRGYWFQASLPADAVVDPETGDLVSLPPDLPDYFVASCGGSEGVCYWHEVLLSCEAERCEVIADNGVAEGEIDCSVFHY